MAETEGIVININAKGTATVLIQTEPGGCIPGAQEVNHCHCSGCSSRIIVEATNELGAVTGQRVRVSHRPGVVMKSVGMLLGIPSGGILLGWSLGAVLFYHFAAASLLAFLVGAVISLGGITSGLLLYRRGMDEARPYITRIVSGAFPNVTSINSVDSVCGVRP